MVRWGFNSLFTYPDMCLSQLTKGVQIAKDVLYMYWFSSIYFSSLSWHSNSPRMRLYNLSAAVVERQGCRAAYRHMILQQTLTQCRKAPFGSRRLLESLVHRLSIAFTYIYTQPILPVSSGAPWCLYCRALASRADPLWTCPVWTWYFRQLFLVPEDLRTFWSACTWGATCSQYPLQQPQHQAPRMGHWSKRHALCHGQQLYATACHVDPWGLPSAVTEGREWLPTQAALLLHWWPAYTQRLTKQKHCHHLKQMARTYTDVMLVPVRVIEKVLQCSLMN